MNHLIGYHEGSGFLYRLTGVSKLIFFILVSIACMTTYDTRLLITVCLLSLLLFKSAHIRWQQIAFVVKLITLFSILNVLMVFLFAPSYGEMIYHHQTILIQGFLGYHISLEELFYLINLILKYFCTVPLAILFILTTNPSQFAASLNQIGVSYKIAYAVSLTLRYIPDVQEEFHIIKTAQQARGLDLSSSASLWKKITGNIQIVVPLILSSLDRIEVVTTAMELRRFGKNKKRTWYHYQKLDKDDYIVLVSAVLILLVSLLLFGVNHGRFYNPWI